MIENHYTVFGHRNGFARTLDICVDLESTDRETSEWTFLLLIAHSPYIVSLASVSISLFGEFQAMLRPWLDICRQILVSWFGPEAESQRAFILTAAAVVWHVKASWNNEICIRDV